MLKLRKNLRYDFTSFSHRFSLIVSVTKLLDNDEFMMRCKYLNEI